MEKNTILRRLEESSILRNVPTKAMLTFVCLSLYTWHIGFSDGSPWWSHLMYSFCHVNIFHLLVNLMVLWQIRNRIPVVEGLLVAFVASYLPMYVSEPTMGLSGFLFAAFGIMWGKTGRVVDAAKAGLPFILFTMLLFNVNGLLHLYAYILGFLLGCVFQFFHRLLGF